MRILFYYTTQLHKKIHIERIKDEMSEIVKDSSIDRIVILQDSSTDRIEIINTEIDSNAKYPTYQVSATDIVESNTRIKKLLNSLR